MTTDEFIKKQEAKIREIERSNKPLEIAVRSIMSLQSIRIFLEGKNKSNGTIGTYTAKEIYISQNASKGLPKFPLKGKEGKTEFNNGNKHKSGYFKSYLDFKNTIGRNKRIKTVDLFLTGALSRNWANAESFTNAKAYRVNQHNYIVALKEENAVKVDRYGKDEVFGLSKNEKEQFLKVLQFELNKALK